MDDMKDSGIPWLGEIPAEWEINRFKFCYQFRKGLSITKSDLLDEGVPVISYGQIHSKENNGIECKNSLLRFVSPEYKKTDKKSLTDYGDTIWADTSEDYAGIGNNIRIDKNQKIFAGYHTIITHPINDAISKYHNYFFQSVIYRDQLRASALGVKVYSITKSMIGNSYIVIPPKEEQQRIADFLDEKCGEIDGIVAKIQQEMETLKQYKQSVISEAVTKGIRQNVPMKDSGIPWVKEIPSHWDLRKIKTLFTLRSEKNYLPLEEVNLISLYTDLGVIQHADLEKTSGNKAVNAEGYKKVYRDDIVVNIILCWMGAIGRSNYNGVTSPAYDIYKPKSGVSSYFFHYYFRTKGFSGDCYKYGKGIMAMRWRTYSSQFLNIVVAVPPLEEQREIAAYLDQKCAAIDGIISSKEEQLQTLSSYKKSLIYEYVTGKKRVPTA